MLSKPHHGWTEISIGSFTGRGSHIQDLPVLFLEAFLRALAYNIPAEIRVDEEDSSFTIRAHHSTSITAHRSERETFLTDADTGMLARELVNDLRRNWQEWLEWPAEIRLAPEKERALLLRSRSAQLSRLTRELENHLR